MLVNSHFAMLSCHYRRDIANICDYRSVIHQVRCPEEMRNNFTREISISLKETIILLDNVILEISPGSTID